VPKGDVDKSYWQKLTILLIVFTPAEQRCIGIWSNTFDSMGWKWR